METQKLIREIGPTTTQEWIKNGALLVDVREKDEVAVLAFDVPNIMYLPLSEFVERFQEIPKDRDVVVVCKAGVRSLRAAGYLAHHGYTNAVNMQYGLACWVQMGFPTRGNTAAVAGSDACCTAEGCC
jgi:rhodanese-related sulfurtransferase